METHQHGTFIPEFEVDFEGGSNLNKRCSDCLKNSGHENFFTVSELHRLPLFWQSEKGKDYVRTKWDLTVRIAVSCTSQNRPATHPSSGAPYPGFENKGSTTKVRYGTGMVYSVQDKPSKGPCPCVECCESESSKPVEEYYEIFVQTSTHVIYDETEVYKAQCDCFYDSDDKLVIRSIKRLYGINVSSMDGNEMYRSDTCKIQCVTHEKSVWERLREVCNKSLEGIQRDDITSSALIISHPHGCSKHISVGNIVHFELQSGQLFTAGKPLKFKGQVICRLPLFPWSASPGQIESPNGQSVSPGQTESPNDQSVSPGQTESPNGQSVSPGQTESPIGQNISPGQTESPNGQSISPGQTESPNDQSVSPGQAESPSGQDVFPGQTESPNSSQSSINVLQQTKHPFLQMAKERLTSAAVSQQPEKAPFQSKGLALKSRKINVIPISSTFLQKQTTEGGLSSSDATKQTSEIRGAEGGLPFSNATKQTSEIQGSVGGLLFSDATKQTSKVQGAEGGLPISDATNQINIPLSKRIIGPGRKLSERKIGVVSSPKKYIGSQVNFKKQSVESSTLVPGSTFKLPSDMTFTLPLELEYVFRFHCGNGRWFNFPPGTTFTVGGKDIFLPPEAEFYLNQMVDFDVFSEKYLMAYDIPTCPGSSGAAIYHDKFDEELFFPYATHAGSLVGNKCNRSGLSYIIIQSK